MKIYFIASSENGRGDLNEEILALLPEYGEVLMGDSSDDADAGYAYERNLEMMQEAEVVVAEVSYPNSGQGYQIGIAEAEEKRILCIFRQIDGQGPSPMILGNRKLSVAEYETAEDLEGILRDFF